MEASFSEVLPPSRTRYTRRRRRPRFPARRWPSLRPTRSKSGQKKAPKRLKSPDAEHGFAFGDLSPEGGRRLGPSSFSAADPLSVVMAGLVPRLSGWTKMVVWRHTDSCRGYSSIVSTRTSAGERAQTCGRPPLFLRGNWPRATRFKYSRRIRKRTWSWEASDLTPVSRPDDEPDSRGLVPAMTD